VFPKYHGNCLLMPLAPNNLVPVGIRGIPRGFNTSSISASLPLKCLCYSNASTALFQLSDQKRICNPSYATTMVARSREQKNGRSRCGCPGIRGVAALHAGQKTVKAYNRMKMKEESLSSLSFFSKSEGTLRGSAAEVQMVCPSDLLHNCNHRRPTGHPQRSPPQILRGFHM
jgi:hypothetical protein